MCGRAGRQWRGLAGRELGAFRRRPRPALLIVPCSADIASCVARCRFSRLRPEIPHQASRQLFSARASADS